MTDAPGVVVTLPEIYKKVLETDDKLDRLAISVEEMVSINKRLDQHHERLNDHGTRLGVLETSQAVAAAIQRPKAPWYATVGAIVGIVAGVGSIITLIALLGQISKALTV